MTANPPLSRRRLLQTAAGGGAALAVLGAAGCRSAVSRAAGPTGEAGRPVRGGTINAGITTDLIPGNFFTNTTEGITVLIGLAFDTLIRYRADSITPTPWLATSWQLADDGRSLTLDLRDDVRFHSGRPFTAKDVEFSIRTYADPLWTAQLKSTAAAVTSFDTTDPYRIVLGFAHPLGNIFDLLDTVPIVDSETLGDLRNGSRFIGTGPFRVTGWTPNSRLSFERNPDYWVPGRPYADAVEVTVIPDAKALLSALRSGQIDFAEGLSYLDTATVTSRSGFADLQLTGAEKQLYVGSNVRAKPLDDPRVRQAIAYALDRDRIVAEVLRGVGYPINLPWPRYSPAFDAARNSTYTRDLARAKELVAQVGTLPTIPFTYTSPQPLLDPTAAIIQADLAEVGIAVELQPIDNSQFAKQLIGAKFPGLWLAIHSWAQYTPSTLTVSAYPFNAHKNASQFTSERYIAAADAAWSIPDGDSPQARQAYAKVSDNLLDSLFLSEIAIALPQWARSTRLQGTGWTKRSEVLLTDAWLTGDRP
ncbi:ABC transporter substrate-binding protein [Enemella evansiae]|uniref:ABC transporter substrate-binding protein n=1 Tax=Enemella evansiae TaxID=2016499 RepID=UPI00105E4D28|nr:ABC transporter substrate-binding protein [Enemella evansiae]TDO92958.1 peptide/nickel transport system substrate-binding protein [Enemella evansiae]